MHKAAEVLRANAEKYALLMTDEMGKTIREARAEATKCAWVCDYYAENAERFLSPEPIETDAVKSFARFGPIGPVLAVMPWNFPMWQVFRFAAPTLMAGDTGLLEHASNVPGCAGHRGGLHRSGLPRRRLPDAAHRLAPGRGRHLRLASEGRHADGLRAGRQGGRDGGG